MTTRNVKCTLLWFIENYSHSGGYLTSPEFTLKGLGGSSWTLSLFPTRLNSQGCQNSVYLVRSSQDSGPQNLSLKIELSIIKAGGSTLFSKEYEHAFSKGDARGFKAYVNMEELFVHKNTDFLPGDTLGVRCRLWNGKGSVECVEQCTARTCVGLEQVRFTHRVKHFSSLRLNEICVLRKPSHTNSGCVFTSSLSLRDACANDGNGNYQFVSVSITPSDYKYQLKRLKLSLLDASENAVKCAQVDYRFADFEEHKMNQNQIFNRNHIISKREECLPNDELSLLCEGTFTTGGVEHTEIKKQLHGTPKEVCNSTFPNACKEEDNKTPEDRLYASKDTEASHSHQSLTNTNLNENTFPNNINPPSTSTFVAHNQMTVKDSHKGPYSCREKLSKCPCALDDFETLYRDQLFTDVVLKTATKSFPAHKGVLSARSSVFRAMLTNDMREASTLHVEDLNDDTVRRLLLFLYSDHLEELRWESALRLYNAASQYAVERLKVLCCSFLLDDISTSNASELLLLADTHGDRELRQSVEDFILDHSDEIFISEEWEKLSEANHQLAIKTMQLKFKRRKR